MECWWCAVRHGVHNKTTELARGCIRNTFRQHAIFTQPNSQRNIMEIVHNYYYTTRIKLDHLIGAHNFFLSLHLSFSSCAPHDLHNDFRTRSARLNVQICRGNHATDRMIQLYTQLIHFSTHNLYAAFAIAWKHYCFRFVFLF